MFALDGIDVLALESGISAPLCTRLLGDFGAEVVKVERPGVGDVNRHWDSVVNGSSSAHAWVDRNKKSIELDLKADEGREVFFELASEADVVVQNYSPGVVERLGIAYEDLAHRNDGLIYINLSGYGQDGPYADRKAYDMVMQGETGLILMNGSPDAPAKIPLSICDINAGMYSAMAALVALFHRERTGEGQEIETTMFGGIVSWLGYFPHKYWHAGEIPERKGMRHHLLTPYGPHETADGEYINFAVLSRDHWETFCADVIDRPELATDPRFEDNESRMANRETFESIIETEIASESRDYWANRFDEVDLPWGDVNQLDEVLDHPQTDHLELVQEIETADGSLRFIDNPIDFNELEHRREPMPELGEHTDEVLMRHGFSDEDIRRLENMNVI
ncbi:MAG: CaiB/BaiF CoA transferase family protein [Salinirussus sp.]